MDKLLLNAAEKNNLLWKKLKSHYEEKLEACRKQNDGELDPIQTAKLRGRIVEIKSFLALENPPPSLKAGEEQSPPAEEW